MPANATFTEIVTSTLRNHPSIIADNISENNALYRRMRQRNKVTLQGGYEIVRPLDYQENPNYQRFSMYDTLAIGAGDVLSAAKYDWVNAAVHVAAAGEEMRKNDGPEEIFNLVRARLNNAKRTAANNMSIDLYSSGALTNQMGGLALLIQNNGTGTVGGIAAGAASPQWPFWMNQFYEMPSANAWSKSNIRGYMNTLWLRLVRGGDKPQLIVSSHDFYSAYWESQQDLQRYANSDSATSGFQELKFVTADVIFDDNTNFSTTAEKMYFLDGSVTIH